jgi:hypothetical protein
VSAGTFKAWRHAGLVSGKCYNDKGQALYHPPGPNPPARTTDHPVTDVDTQQIRRKPVLNGLINEYMHAA